MAVVIIGGLITTTLMMLLVVPTFYLWFAPRPELETTRTLLNPGLAVSGASD
jgi:Cu/Ag efflux pump CusA